MTMLMGARWLWGWWQWWRRRWWRQRWWRQRRRWWWRRRRWWHWREWQRRWERFKTPARRRCSSGVMQGPSLSIIQTLICTLSNSLTDSFKMLSQTPTFSNSLSNLITDSFFLHNIIFQSWRGFQIKNFQPGDWSETIMIHCKPWWQKWNQSETIMIYCKLWWKNAINLKQLRRKGEKWCWEEESYIQQLVFLSEEENL